MIRPARTTDRNAKAAVTRHYRFVEITAFVAGHGGNKVMGKHLKYCPQCSVCAYNVRVALAEMEATMAPSLIVEILEEKL